MKKYIANSKYFNYVITIDNLSLTITGKESNYPFKMNKSNSKDKIANGWLFFILLIEEASKNQSNSISLDTLQTNFCKIEYKAPSKDSIKKSIEKLNNNYLKDTNIRINIKGDSYILNCNIENEVKVKNLHNEKIYSTPKPEYAIDSKDRIPQTLSMFENDTDIPIIFNVDEITKHNDSEFFYKIDEIQRLLISSPGGQGKTRFLKIIKNFANETNYYSHVIYVYLPNLLTKEINEELAVYDYPTYYLFNNYITNNKLSSETLKNCGIQNKKKGRNFKRLLVLLDDYNGLIASPQSIVKDRIRDSIKELSENWSNTTTIITTRNTSYTNNNKYINFKEMDLFNSIGKLSGVPIEECEKLILKYNIETDEFLHILQIPMYYIMLSSLDNSSKPTNIYELFDYCLQRMTNQRINKETNYQNIDLLLFTNHVVLPYIAQYMNKNLMKTLSKSDFSNCIEELFAKKNYCDSIFQFICSMNNHENEYTLPSKKHEEILFKSLLFESDYINNIDGNLCFIHENWQDFFCAKNIINNITILQNEYKDINVSKEIDINFNTNIFVNEMVKKILGLMPSKNKTNISDIIISNYKKLFDKLEIEYSNTSLIFGMIEYIYLSFIIRDYLQLESIFSEKDSKTEFIKDFDEEKHKIISKLIDHLQKNKTDICFLASIKNNCNNVHLLELISSEISYYRKQNSIDKAESRVELGYFFDKNSSEIIHHDAKLHLCEFQNKFDDSIVDEKLFNNSFNLLKTNATENKFYLSANLYGKFIVSPAPFLLENKFVSLDFVAAFYTYFYATCPNNNKGNIRIARDSEYTLRQALAMLIKGYVKTNENEPYIPGSYNLEKGQIIMSDLRPNNLSPNTVCLVEDLYKLIEGQSTAFLNFIRNQLSWYKCNKVLTEDNFHNPLGGEFTLPYLLQKKYLLNDISQEKNIELNYQELIKKLLSYKSNNIEMYHPIYQYLDCLLYDISHQEHNSKTNDNDKTQKSYAIIKANQDLYNIVDLILHIYTNK